MVGGLRKVINFIVMGQVTELCEPGAHSSGGERHLSSTQLVPECCFVCGTVSTVGPCLVFLLMAFGARTWVSCMGLADHAVRIQTIPLNPQVQMFHVMENSDGTMCQTT